MSAQTQENFTKAIIEYSQQHLPATKLSFRSQKILLPNLSASEASDYGPIAGRTVRLVWIPRIAKYAYLDLVESSFRLESSFASKPIHARQRIAILVTKAIRLKYVRSAAMDINSMQAMSVWVSQVSLAQRVRYLFMISTLLLGGFI